MNATPERESVDASVARLFESHGATALRLRQSTAAERRLKLTKLLAAILERKDALLEAAHRDLGKHPTETNLTEVLPLVGELKHAIAKLKRWMKPHRVGPTMATLGTRSRVMYQPKGRCLLISPWNYPLSLALGPLVSAVAAGNTAVLKPSEFTPHTNRVIKDIVGAVFAADEVAIVEGAADTATALLSLPFDHIFFTGSPAVGKIVMAAAARNLASVTLELGGKSPVIVDASADLRGAAEHIIWGKMVNAGQTCIAPDYVYVHRDVADRFVELCRSTIAQRYGDTDAAIKASPDFPRMIHRRHAERVARLIDEAVQSGSQLAFGGASDAESRYVGPTLLRDVPAGTQIRKEEIFGPALPILTFDSLDTVIAEINAGTKPLALYVWSKSERTIQAIETNTSSGSLCVNLCLQQFAQHNLPFGGVNTSGIGNAHGFFGFKAFSHERAVMSAGPLSALEMLFPPYDARKRRLSELLIKYVT
ncbi:aldehyde dehydrogenase family protein [Steroidobacter agaridevorans]|uniref:aldehyde dehydrogenase family protein n=1 Tax=Steroidobacter agaridevorans TaxID=2695856 RepID=UPI001326C7F0|nr:aldehyde dehydrogenase family protein [Steroidobacter agaridevorans]GFE87635.1 aldehyde dehydrogenase [Steroidobacter agaridevorans]